MNRTGFYLLSQGKAVFRYKMNKIFVLFLFLGFIQSTQASTLISLSNNMMTSSNGQVGVLDMGTFDPFNPAANCNTFSTPNTCIPNGRDPIAVSLSFNYSVALDALSGSSVDLFFNVNNGYGGSTGEFINLIPPTNIFSLHDGNIGSFDLSFEIPLFGPNSHYDYGLDLTIDVTINP